MCAREPNISFDIRRRRSEASRGRPYARRRSNFEFLAAAGRKFEPGEARRGEASRVEAVRDARGPGHVFINGS